jgi:hypothetical protein
VFTPDESTLYFQVSFFNGVVEYDVATDRITRSRRCPRTRTPARPDDVGQRLAAPRPVDEPGRHRAVRRRARWTTTPPSSTRATLQEGPLVPASKPYWATVSGDGRDCRDLGVGADRVTAISFATGQRVTSVAVGDHPQRVRIGRIQDIWTAPR